MKIIYVICLMISFSLIGCKAINTDELLIEEINDSVIEEKNVDLLTASNDNTQRNKEVYKPILFLSKKPNNELTRAYVLGATNGLKWFKVEDLDFPDDYDNDYLEKDFKNEFIKEGDTCIIYDLNGIKKNITINQTTIWFSPSTADTILWAYFDKFITEDDFFIGSTKPMNLFSDKLVYSPDNENMLSLDLDNNGIQDSIVIEKLIPTEESLESLNIRINLNNSLIDIKEWGIQSLVGEFFILPVDINSDGKYEILTYTLDHGEGIQIYELFDNGFEKVLTFYDGD